MNKNVPLTLAGEVTPRTVIYKHESHKLHQAFVPKLKAEGSTDRVQILKSQPVALTADGEVEVYTGAKGQIYLGIAVTDSINPAYKATRNYPIEVTVMVEAFAICNYVAAAALSCGYVKPNGDTVNNHFVTVEESEDETKFICITPADEANDVVQVLIR